MAAIRLSLLLLSLMCALVYATDVSQAQLYIVGEEVSELLLEATRASNEGNFPAALQALREAEAVPGISPQGNELVQQSIFAYLVQMNDLEGALAQVQSMLKGEIGNVYRNIHSCIRLLLESGRNDFSATCVSIIPRPVDESLIDFPE